MTSISSIGSSISKLFTTGSTDPTTSTSSTEDTGTSSANGSNGNGYLGDVLGITQTTGIMGLPTAGAPGDSDLLLAEIELKLQKTITETRNNSALAVGIQADIQAIGAQVIAINGFEHNIDTDNAGITSDTDSLNNTYLPEQAADLTAKKTADQNLTNAQNAITNAQNSQKADTSNITAAQQDEQKQLAIINSKTSSAGAKQAAQAAYNQDAQNITSYQNDRDVTQQDIINTQTNAINGVNGQPGLQSIATAADSAYTQVSQIVTSLQNDVTAKTNDLTTQATNVANSDTAIVALVTDLAQKLSIADLLSGRGIVDQENSADGQDWMINRQFEKVTENLKNLVDVDTLAQKAQVNQEQAINEKSIDRITLAAAGLAGSLLDLVNTLSSLTPPPNADAGSQSFATGGSRLKIGV